MQAAATEAYKRLDGLGVEDSSQVVWSLAKLGHRPSRGEAVAIEARLGALLNRMGPRALTCILHAMSWMGMVPSTSLLKVGIRKPYFIFLFSPLLLPVRQFQSR